MAVPLIPEDLLRFVLPTALTLAPDGRALVLSQLGQDAGADAYRSSLWWLSLDTLPARPRALTSARFHERDPAWSPDGQWLAFISDRGGSDQIWLLPLQGGEPRQVTWMNHGAAHPRWSPDGSCLLFLADAHPGTTPFLSEQGAAVERKGKTPAGLRQITRLQYHWDGVGILEGRTHLWLVDVSSLLESQEPVTLPLPRQLTSGDYDHADPTWSPDGKQIAFVSDRANNRDANVTSDLWVLTVADGRLICLTASESKISRPAWSPDGQRLAWYAAPVDSIHGFTNTHVFLAECDERRTWTSPCDLLDGQDQCVSTSVFFDLLRYEAASPCWLPDGQGVVVPIVERGEVHDYQVRVAGGAPARITRGPTLLGPQAVTPDGRYVVSIALTTARAPDLVQMALDMQAPESSARWCTDLNPWLQEKALAVPERFPYTAPDGWPMEGWILWPPSSHSTATEEDWPVVLQIHGGPHSFYGPLLHPQMQLLAGAGYAVVFLNPRGSLGYGEVFARACEQDWAGADANDVLAGLDAALARGSLDSERLAVTGPSYGGYLTNWLISHSDRFKAAVPVNGVSNLLSCFLTSDTEATYTLREYGGTPWQRWDYFIERSPLTYAPSVRTPTRVMAAEADGNVPIEQSDQWYTALKLLGKAEVDYVRVPGASHSVNSASPRQRVAHRAAILEWITRFVPAGRR